MPTHISGPDLSGAAPKRRELKLQVIEAVASRRFPRGARRSRRLYGSPLVPTALNEYAGSATGETARSYFLRNGGRNDDARINCLLSASPHLSAQAGMTVLIHAAAGGLGLIFCQWAKLLGLTVIGTVSTEEKAEIARAHGCDHIMYTREQVPKRVREITNGEGVPVVYDSVGKDTFAGSRGSLRRRGLLVCVARLQARYRRLMRCNLS